jgi:tetratricopeptide (TPR) repeat protein
VTEQSWGRISSACSELTAVFLCCVLLALTFATESHGFLGVKGHVTRNLLIEARQARTMESYELAEELLLRLLKLKTGTQRIGVLSELILVYDESGQNDKAIAALEQMIDLLRETGDQQLWMTKTYAKLAECQSQGARYQDAEASCIEALSWAQDCNTSETYIGSILHNLGYAQESLGKFDSAEVQYLSALKHLSQEPDRSLQGLTAANLAELYLRLGKKTQARRYYKLAISSLQSVSDRDDFVLESIVRQYETLCGRSNRTKKKIAGH